MKSIIAFILFVSIETINAQVTQEWASRYNQPGTGQDYASSIAVDDSGNVYVTGMSRSEGNVTQDDYATIKYNSSGIEQWVNRYNGPGNGNDWAYSIAVDDSSNVYVTGSSGGGLTSSDYATIKYNSSGDTVWISRYDGPANIGDFAYSIAVDDSGNVYVTGLCGVGAYAEDYATIKYNSAGVQQWAERYNGPENGDDYANSITLDDSGNVYVTGTSDGSGTLEDYATIKYNSAGVQQWAERYNGPENSDDNASSIAVDGSGNVYVTGKSWGSGTSWDYITIKYNSTGMEQWAERYNGPGNSSDEAQSIAVDSLGNVYVTGKSFGSGTGEDYATIKYNSAGVEQWVQRYNGPGNGDDNAYSIALDSSGNVYVTGGNYVSLNDLDFATIKYNSAGAEQWVQRYNGLGNSGDWALSIALDGSGNVYVAGGSIGNETYFDYATVKYSQSTGVYQTTPDLPEKYSLSQNYPNPFNPITTIRFELPEESMVNLKVYNIRGEEVATVINDYRTAGSYQFLFDGSNLTSGVYFFRLQAGEFTKTVKTMMIK